MNTSLRPLVIATALGLLALPATSAAENTSTATPSPVWPAHQVGVLDYQLDPALLIKTGPIRLGQMDFRLSQERLDQIRAENAHETPERIEQLIKIEKLKKLVWLHPYSFIIPNERPHWAMAMAHAAQLFKNVTGIDDPYHDANLYAAKTLQESAVGADYDNVPGYFTYPVQPNYTDSNAEHQNLYGIWNTLGVGRTSHDGFFQLEGHMYSAYGELMRMFPQRFYKGKKPDSIYKVVEPYEMTSPIYNAVFKPEKGKNSFVPSAIGASYFNIFAYYTLARSADELGTFIQSAKDPLALTKLISVGYNRGLSPDSMALNPLKPVRRAECMAKEVIDDCFDPENQGGFGTSYLYQVPYKSKYLKDIAENNGPGYPGYYTSQLNWLHISTYLDALTPLYTPEEIASAKSSAQAVFDATASNGTIDFANQFGAVLDAILLALPVDTPWTQLCASDGGSYDAWNRDGSFRGIEKSYRCNPESVSKPLVLGTRPADRPPVVHAGSDQFISAAGTVHLNGSQSYEPDGDAVTYNWSQLTGTPVTLTTTGPHAYFDAYAATTATKLTFRLTATANGKTAFDEVVITLRPNQAPIIHVKPLNEVYEGDTVLLDATETIDPDGDTLIYRWSGLPNGDVVSSSSPTLNFTATNIGNYTVSLTVTDSKNNASSTTIPVTVKSLTSGSTWDPTKEYQKGDKVKHRNKEFTAKWVTQAGEEPGVSIAWEQTYDAGVIEWDPMRIYKKGEKAIYKGKTYQARWYADGQQVPGAGGEHNPWIMI
ncbi:PKD domain-containing protein [Vibrio sp. Of7-15]|uniref:PKD domain-containing protein n=1 Tax=Vibrio sp. Of7-15 TaxID=2724879 RepID=UPI001EF29C9F|nr:PKD domain-containing protein [Vibrio sp. Of7-15]MCG7498083.1 PKD domain-containing protein [Vibrio sp. Of7-15]